MYSYLTLRARGVLRSDFSHTTLVTLAARAPLNRFWLTSSLTLSKPVRSSACLEDSATPTLQYGSPARHTRGEELKNSFGVQVCSGCCGESLTGLLRFRGVATSKVSAGWKMK